MANKRLAGIEYHGVAGSSLDCEAAVVSLINSNRTPMRARILTSDKSHALLLQDQEGDYIAVKSGFASGYGGTGPSCFSLTLQLLETHGCELSESNCEATVLERLDNSALTDDDLKKILNCRPISPSRLHGYIREAHYMSAHAGSIWAEINGTVPFALIEPAIFDLALKFQAQPDAMLLAGYKRLEDRVRERTKLKSHGGRLFSDAFLSGNAPLYWKNIDDAERIGRGNLFTGAFAAHRNPRAHKYKRQSYKDVLSEFLLMNHLYKLEREAIGPRRKRKPK